MRDLMGDLFTGGNHLAQSLVARGCFPDKQTDYAQVDRDYGDLCADMWVAWRAIMNLKKAGEDIADEPALFILSWLRL